MKTTIIIFGLVLGLLYCGLYKHSDVVEPFNTNSNCPNILVQEGNKLMLLNNKKARIPGVNPIYFNNLEEYVEFANWQQANKINCPILYFQKVETATGEGGFRMMPDPIEKNAGLPTSFQQIQQPLYDASHDDKPYNKNSYPGMDQSNQNIGVYTPLDKLYNSSSKDDAMNPAWHGGAKTRLNIKKGLYNADFRYDIGTKGAPAMIPENRNNKISKKKIKQARNFSTPGGYIISDKAPIMDYEATRKAGLAIN